MISVPIIKNIYTTPEFSLFNLNKEWIPFLVNRKQQPVKRLGAMKHEFGIMVNGTYVFLGFRIRPESSLFYYKEHKKYNVEVKDFQFWNGFNQKYNTYMLESTILFEKEIFSKQFNEKTELLVMENECLEKNV